MSELFYFLMGCILMGTAFFFVRSMRRLSRPDPPVVTFLWQIEGHTVQVVGNRDWTTDQVRDAVLYDLPQRIPVAQHQVLTIMVQHILRNDPIIIRSNP